MNGGWKVKGVRRVGGGGGTACEVETAAEGMRGWWGWTVTWSFADSCIMFFVPSIEEAVGQWLSNRRKKGNCFLAHRVLW